MPAIPFSKQAEGHALRRHIQAGHIVELLCCFRDAYALALALKPPLYARACLRHRDNDVSDLLPTRAAADEMLDFDFCRHYLHSLICDLCRFELFRYRDYSRRALSPIALMTPIICLRHDFAHASRSAAPQPARTHGKSAAVATDYYRHI